MLHSTGRRLASLVIFAAVITGSRQQEPLVVNMGRSAALEPRHIRLIPPGHKPCRIEVLRNDPISQRVGQLEPAAFDCDFPPNHVHYYHSGSPLLRDDRVKLLIHVFGENETMTSLNYVTVRIARTPHEVVVPGHQLRVMSFFGQSDPIDASILRFRYERGANVVCTVGFSRFQTHFPLLGNVMKRNESGSSVDALRMDCEKFLKLGLYYKHLSPPSPNVDYLPLEVELSEEHSAERPRRERFYLPININGAFPNTPPKAAFASSYVMDAQEFVLTPLDSFVLSAKDGETSADQLIFNITQAPSVGQFVHLGERTRPITSFRQEDVTEGQIAYAPPTVSYSEKKVVFAEFQVFDSQFAASQPITMHIAIQPSANKAPRVYTNAGLTVLEGQSRPITTKNLRIVDRDSIDDVRISVRGGLRHGSLEVNGSKATWFTAADIEHGQVVYHHDDSDNSRDSILLRITDGDDTTRIKFAIDVLQRDDSPPYLVNNVGIEVSQGGYAQIRTDILSAHDRDSNDEKLKFVLLTAPKYGELVSRLRPMTLGVHVEEFTQEKIYRGYIYYHHYGGESLSDSFEIVIVDNNDPPNESGKLTMMVHVTPGHDMPPRQSAGSSRQITVNETGWVEISRSELQYTDAESDDAELVYTITTVPFFLKSTITADAGCIVDADDLKLNDGNATSLTPLTHFTQRQVNHGKVAYVPPFRDIGALRRHAQFVFSVADSHDNTIFDETFDVTILPVNNLVPSLTVRDLIVKEGGSVKITTNEISAYDRDSDHSQLTFRLAKIPKFGRLLKSEHQMSKDDSFTLSDLSSNSMRYVHDGSAVERDRFVIAMSDGINTASERVPIRVRLVDDEMPRALRQHDNIMAVPEGGDVVLTKANLAATDNDTDDGTLTFTVLQSPQFGQLQIDGQRVREFSQNDVWEGLVHYVHSAGEAGSRPTPDRITFSVTDLPSRTVSSQVIGLKINITAVNTESPDLLPGSPLFVNECQKAALTPEVMSANDADTKSDRLTFVISEKPSWGFLENTAPSTGSEVSNAGIPISSFTLSEMRAGLVNYVQKNCSGLEPHGDRIGLLVTDGTHNSPKSTIEVIIVPENDEAPRFELADLTVEEGGENVIGPRMINISDADVPADKLMLNVVDAPRHGKLVLLKHVADASDVGTANEGLLAEVAVYDLLHNTYIVYQHDGSEAAYDSFVLRVTDGKHEVTRASDVVVRARNDEPVRLVRNRALQLDYGGSRVLSTKVLKAVDADTSAGHICYVLLRAPKKGSLQLFVSGDWHSMSVGENFTQADLDRNSIRYAHTKPLNGVSADEFAFRVTDGHSSVEHQTFNVKFPGSSDGLVLVTGKASVAAGGRTVLNTNILSASDETGKPQEIVFSVRKAPKYGRLVTNRRKQTVITSFSQLDLAAQTVYYEQTEGRRDERDSFSFVVKNSMGLSKEGVINISIQSVEKALPTLDVNVPLTVQQGEITAITSANLHVSDPDTSTSRLTYVLVEPPNHGRLLRGNESIISAFSQHDIDKGLIVYKSENRDELGMDYFLFNVTDLRGSSNSTDGGYLINGTRQTKPAFFSVLIQPPMAQLPRLVVNRKPDILEDLGDGRRGFVLNARYLKATHKATASSDILYTLLQHPRRGELQHTSRRRNIRRRFTQEDIDRGHIVYVLKRMDGAAADDDDVMSRDLEQTTSDMFTFRVQDRSNNALDKQQFHMEWSSIQFVDSQYNVCEDLGALTVLITRQGALAQSAFVGIQTRGRSATKGVDYKPSEITQLQFDPGVRSLTWTMDIVKDTLDEETEKLKIQLRNPVNAVLGTPHKTIIHIVNLHKGRCAEYLGMVSKHQTVGKIPMPKANSESELPHASLARTKFSTLRTYHALKAVDTGEDGQTADRPPDEPPRPMKAFGQQTDKEANPTGRQHPLRKFRERNKKRNRKRKHGKKRSKKGKRWSRNRRFGRSFLQAEQQADELPRQQINWGNKLAPRSCTRHSRGLLYSDLMTSQTYRCNGRKWVKWSDAISYLGFNTPTPRPTTAPPGGVTTMSNAESECMEGWSHDSLYGCYKVLAKRQHWDAAEKECARIGGHVTEGTSMEHLQWLSRLAKGRHFWIGLTDAKKRYEWVYISGASVDFTNWELDFPKKQPSLAKHCTLVVGVHSLKWVNRICNKNLAKVVCSVQKRG